MWHKSIDTNYQQTEIVPNQNLDESFKRGPDTQVETPISPVSRPKLLSIKFSSTPKTQSGLKLNHKQPGEVLIKVNRQDKGQHSV
jgi:hypothetical protein